MSKWDDTSKHRRSRTAYASGVLDTSLSRAEREPSKSDLRAMLEQAAKNTAAMAASDEADGADAAVFGGEHG